jgi:hypothetical protein
MDDIVFERTLMNNPKVADNHAKQKSFLNDESTLLVLNLFSGAQTEKRLEIRGKRIPENCINMTILNFLYFVLIVIDC